MMRSGFGVINTCHCSSAVATLAVSWRWPGATWPPGVGVAEATSISWGGCSRRPHIPVVACYVLVRAPPAAIPEAIIECSAG